jgi:cystathionine beta-lyase
LVQDPDGRYVVDWEGFEAAISERTRVFILCNPHNPVGRVFSIQELERMAEICLQHGVAICSDEIHADFLYPGQRHVPIACLGRDVERQTITLMAPSKTFNIAGLHFAVAIVPDKELRERFCGARRGMIGRPDVLSYVAALAAYRHGQPWLDRVLRYLEDNRGFVTAYVNERLPGISMFEPEGTYLAWMDCRQSSVPGNAHEFFLNEAKVALNDGRDYGKVGEGFVRLNFGCPRTTLVGALGRMEEALTAL